MEQPTVTVTSRVLSIKSTNEPLVVSKKLLRQRKRETKSEEEDEDTRDVT